LDWDLLKGGGLDPGDDFCVDYKAHGDIGTYNDIPHQALQLLPLPLAQTITKGHILGSRMVERAQICM
jgi:hypothetical protein